MTRMCVVLVVCDGEPGKIFVRTIANRHGAKDTLRRK